MAFPLALMAARNTCPNKWTYRVSRAILNASRGTETFVFALVFVAAVGFGPFSGVLTITFHMVGAIGKMFAEAIETVDQGIGCARLDRCQQGKDYPLRSDPGCYAAPDRERSIHLGIQCQNVHSTGHRRRRWNWADPERYCGLVGIQQDDYGTGGYIADGVGNRFHQ